MTVTSPPADAAAVPPPVPAAQVHVPEEDRRAILAQIDGVVPVTIREIAESVVDLVGRGTIELGPARPGDLRARTVSSERARTELGWAPTTSLADGLARTHAWYLARRVDTTAEAVANMTALADLAEAEADNDVAVVGEERGA